jgi:hypothetical protein
MALPCSDDPWYGDRAKLLLVVNATTRTAVKLSVKYRMSGSFRVSYFCWPVSVEAVMTHLPHTLITMHLSRHKT